jgi:hypothetical protein
MKIKSKIIFIALLCAVILGTTACESRLIDNTFDPADNRMQTLYGPPPSSQPQNDDRDSGLTGGTAYESQSNY